MSDDEASLADVPALFAELVGSGLASEERGEGLSDDGSEAARAFIRAARQLNLNESQSLLVQMLTGTLVKALAAAAEERGETSLELWRGIAAGLFGDIESGD